MNFRRITIELHAQAADLAGSRTAGVDVGVDTTCGDVKRLLASGVPALAALVASSALATDREYRADHALVGSDARLHQLPPVSGG
jgi:hypothetical protein